MKLRSSCSTALVVAITSSSCSAQSEPVIPGADSYNGLNLVPQMGWDNWNAFACDVKESLLLDTARSMVDFGLRDLGYNYVVLDDCWSEGRNSSGYLVPNSKTFPNGMKHVADQLHSMNMKFGMYSSAGKYTCAKYPGSLGYEAKDAQFFAENDVDYLKYDNCYNQGQEGNSYLSFNRYNAMSEALNATGRKLVYSMCNWGQDNPYTFALNIANSGRMSGDIFDSFNMPTSTCTCTENPCTWSGYQCSVMNILNKMPNIYSRTQSGYFNDMDMLEVGNSGQDDNEYVTHFSMWSLNSSPLIMGTDVTALSPANLAILSNPAVIAINQDSSATAAFRVWRHMCDDTDQYGQCERSLWVRSLDNGDYAVALLNAGNRSARMEAPLTDIFTLESRSGASKPASELSERWDVHDLWGNRMGDEQAASLINGTGLPTPDMEQANSSMTRYNATQMSYADGVKANVPALFGTRVGVIEPHGTLSADVARHSVGFFRLRKNPDKSMKRNEL